MAVAAVVARTLGAATGLALLGLAIVYGLSEWKLRRTYDAPLVALRAAQPADPAAGLHMARIVGCWAGCHGIRGEGGTERIAGIHETTAPTLTEVVPRYTDEELARLVRYGVKRDGRSAVGMYPRTLWALADQDLADIIAHLRQQPPLPPVPRRQSVSLRGRLALATGEWNVAAEQVDRSMPRWGELPMQTPFERGRYLASIVCSECHGSDYRGDPLEGGPSLAVVAAYDAERFRQLLRTGRPIDGREIPEMSWMPDVGFTEQEIADLYLFLREQHGLAAPK